MRLLPGQRSISPQTLFRTGLDDWFSGRTEAGVRVDYDTALTDDGWFSAVALVAGDIAGLPWRALVNDGQITRPLARQPSWIGMPDPADPAITANVHKMQVALSILCDGNAYVFCEPDIYTPVVLTVLNPVRMRVTKENRERKFALMSTHNLFTDWSPDETGLAQFDSTQILHIPYMLMPGALKGMSPIRTQAGNIGIALAARKWVETFFGKGGMVSGFLSLPPEASGEAVKDADARLKKDFSGWRKGGVIGAIGGGAQWVKTGLTPQDVALDSLWRRNLEATARAIGIPPFMIGSQEPAGVAYASSVERTQHYIDHCLMRYTDPIEQAYSRLVPGDGRLQVPGSNTEVRFNFNALLRGDPKARWEAYQIALNAKSMTKGEVRALENRPPLAEYGDDYLNGPDGLLETPNNNGPKAAGDQTGAPPQ